MIRTFSFLLLAAVTSLSIVSATAFAAESTPASTAVAAAPQTISVGKMVFAANNQRLGAVYRVNGEAIQLIVDGKMMSLPASTVSTADGGKYVTSLTKAEVLRAR